MCHSRSSSAAGLDCLSVPLALGSVRAGRTDAALESSQDYASVRKRMSASARVRYPSISFITARSDPGNVIGFQNRLPWHLGRDLRRFRELTTGHAVIMGRKTFESIGKALPNRINIVMSREITPNSEADPLFRESDGLVFASNGDAALFAADLYSIINERRDIYIIGGENVYNHFERLVNKVHLTLVFSEVMGDAYFNMTFPGKEWKTLLKEDFSKSDIDEFASRYIVYERRKRRYRYRFLREFYTDRFAKQKWVEQMLQKNEKKIRRYELEHQDTLKI